MTLVWIKQNVPSWLFVMENVRIIIICNKMFVNLYAKLVQLINHIDSCYPFIIGNSWSVSRRKSYAVLVTLEQFDQS